VDTNGSEKQLLYRYIPREVTIAPKGDRNSLTGVHFLAHPPSGFTNTSPQDAYVTELFPETVYLNPENGGSNFFQNVSMCLKVNSVETLKARA
jgi:hypothetical protein